MKLPDFLEKLNQGAEKAFGENAKSMIDSLLYAKLPPTLKRSVNMARWESGIYEEIVAYLERELDFIALGQSDDMPMGTMASTSTNKSNLPSNGININKDAQCSYCKATGHIYKSCTKLKKKKELKDKTARSPSVKLTKNAQPAGKESLRANRLLAKMIQKTNFATTTNT